MKLKEFTVIFGVMCEYFGATPSAGLTEIYYQDLKDLKESEFKEAFSILRSGRVYNGLPKIAEIKEALYGKAEDAAAIAWQSLMNTLRDHGFWDSVVFEDGAIGRSVEAMGGWIEVSGWTVEEWRMRRKEFEALYMANFRRGSSDPVRLTGFFEVHNGREFKGITPKLVTIKSQNRTIDSKLKLISS